jgi:hypothetical protein
MVNISRMFPMIHAAGMFIVGSILPVFLIIRMIVTARDHAPGGGKQRDDAN